MQKEIKFVNTFDTYQNEEPPATCVGDITPLPQYNSSSSTATTFFPVQVAYMMYGHVLAGRKSCAWALLTILLIAVEYICLMIWIANFPYNRWTLSAYLVIFYAATSILIINIIIVGFISLMRRRTAKPVFENWRYYILHGIVQGGHWIFLIYALIHDRTPILFVEVLFQTSFFVSIPTSVFAFKNHPDQIFKKSICSWKPVIALIMIIWGIGFSVIPSIVKLVETSCDPSFPSLFSLPPSSILTGEQVVSLLNTTIQHPTIHINGFWMLILALAFFPRIIMNVFQERFFKSGKNNFEAKTRNILYFNLFSALFTFLTVLSLWWIDLIPFFGNSQINHFPLVFAELSQVLWSPDKSSTSFYFFVGFILAHFARTTSCSFLNVKKGGNFVNSLMLIAVPLSQLFWASLWTAYHIDKFNSLYYTLCSLIIALIGLFSDSKYCILNEQVSPKLTVSKVKVVFLLVLQKAIRMSNEEKKEPKEPPKEPKEPKEKVKKDSKFDVHDGVASAGASPVGVREKEMGRLPTTRRVKGKEVKDPTPIKRTKKPTYSSPSDRSDKPHSIDKAPLEEFLSLMEEWQKAANSTSSSEHEEPKRDVRSYTNACSQALIKFATKNGIIDPNALPSRVLEVAFTTSRSILDQRNRAQDLLVQSTNAFHLCGNLSQMIHKFLEVFIRFYNSLAQGDTLSDKCNPSASIGLSAGSPPSSAAPPATRDFVHESFKEVYDELEGVGWTSEDELEVYSSLPFKTEFPPVGYRGDNHEELLDSVKSNERVFTLPSLLRRFQYEYTQRTASIVLPKLDSVSSLFNKITSTHSASEDLKRMVLETSGVELGKLFDFESRGGNLFASSRAAMCFLMHAQVILDVISKMPMFGPLFENSKGTSRHTVDLLKNIPHITSFKPNKEKTATTPLLELLREKTGSLTLLDANKTLLDMHKDVEGRKPLQYHPKTDIVYTLIGMFFDAPLLGLKVELERTLLDIKLSQLTASAFFSSSLNFGPMFIHQDSAFFQEFLLKYPTTADSIFYTPIASATADEKKSKGKEKDKEDIRSSVTMNKKFSEPTSKFIAHLQNGLGGAGGVGVGVGGGGGGGTTTTTTTTTATASTSPKEKALLLANLLKLTSSPDHFLPPQSCTEPSPVDDKALNYIFKRSISTSTFDHLHATLCSISAQSRPFCFTPPATPVSILSPRQALNSTNSPHLEEIIDRYTSLLLGSNQAVPYAERSSAPYLSLDTIIPFLHRNKSAIIDSSKSKEVRVLGYEYELVRSPLVQIIFKLAALKSKQSKESNPPQVRLKSAQKVMTDSQPWISTGEDEISDVSAVIDKLYLLWDSKQDLNGNTKLNQFIMKVIATHRYENFNVREALKTNVEKAEAEVEFWLTVEKQVEAFMGFLRRYEVALNDSTPFRVLLSPTSSADLNVVDEDAQLPQEIY